MITNEKHFVDNFFIFPMKVGQNWQIPFSGKKKKALCLIFQTN